VELISNILLKNCYNAILNSYQRTSTVNVIQTVSKSQALIDGVTWKP